MNYAFIALIILCTTIPNCSLRKEKKKQSVHQKRKASQRAAYAADPGKMNCP